MKFWPKYVGEWKKKTSDLSLAEKGAYSEMLDYCYANESALPAELNRIFSIVGARSAMEERAVEVVLRRFFVKNGVGFINERAQEELAKWHDRSSKATESARKRWRK